MKKKKSKAWIKVFEEVNAFMEQHLDKWNTIAEIRKTYDEFVNNLKKLKDLQPELERDITPLRQELADKRDTLSGKLLPVGNILEVYAEDHRIGKKARLLISGQKKLESCSDNKLLDHANRFHKITDKYIQRALNDSGSAQNLPVEGEPLQDDSVESPPGKKSPSEVRSMEQIEPGEDSPSKVRSMEQTEPGKDITRYGLTLEMLDELYSAKQQFQSTLRLHDDVISYRKKTQKKKDGLIRANRKLLKNRLNKLMTVFSGTHPSFYKEYSSISSNK
jgi:hypothetical protein